MISTLQRLDFGAIQWATAAMSNHGWLRAATYLSAEVLILAFPVVYLFLWHQPGTGTRARKKAVVLGLVSLILALATKSILNYLYLRPRPFITHPGLPHLNITVDPPSFPSGHTLIVFVLAYSLWLSGYRKLGTMLLLAALLVAAGRVFVGVHYPSDVIGGALVGCIVTWYMHREASGLKKYLPDHED